MRYTKSQSLIFLFFLVHRTCSQQPPTDYEQPSSKVQLEDIERDNLKPSPPQSSGPHSQPQYSPYPPQQEQVVYGIPSQHQPPAYPSRQHSSPYSSSPPQQHTAPMYSAQVVSPSSSAASAYASPQYQSAQLVQPAYYNYPGQNVQSVPVFDFGGVPVYLMPQVAPGQSSPIRSSPSDYYKTLQYPPGGPSTKLAHTKVGVPTTQPFLSSYVMPSAYYQPVAFTQPQQSPQYYSGYSPYYQVQTPQKSIYSSGVKSTTPSAPFKSSKDEHFTAINNGYRFEYGNGEPQNAYNKVRVTG